VAKTCRQTSPPPPKKKKKGREKKKKEKKKKKKRKKRKLNFPKKPKPNYWVTKVYTPFKTEF